MPIRDNARAGEPNGSTRNKGRTEEDLAAEYLKEKGCNILERNFTCRFGEIDIIFEDEDGTVCFGEVKYRALDRDGHPEEAVVYGKQKKICRTSDHYRVKYALDESLSYRYDVIAISPGNIRWIKNAFEYII